MGDLRCGCDICGRGRPAVEASFSRNIGMLIMRRSEHVEGRHCASCLLRNFGVFTFLNLTLGWWGTISFVMTIFYTLGNLVTLVIGGSTLAFAAMGERARTKEIESERERVDADAALARFRHTIRMRLRNGESVDAIAEDMVEAANVPHRKALAFVERVALEARASAAA